MTAAGSYVQMGVAVPYKLLCRRQLYTLGEDIICVCYWPFKGVSEGSGFVVLTQLDRGGIV